MSTKRQLLAITTLALVAATASALAQEVEEPAQEHDEPSHPTDTIWRRPLASRNQFPVALAFVALEPDKAGALPDGSTAIDLRFDYSNIISGQETDEELLLLDLEYLRTTAVIKRGLPGQFELGASIPFYVYYGGFLDPFVSGFHDLLGLPNFLRGMADDGETRYELTTGGATPFSGKESVTAVGDLTVHLKKTLVSEGLYALALRSDVKLPTGSLDELSGSGATDVGIGAAFDRITDRWAVYANANYHFLGQPDTLRVKDYLSFMVGVDWRFKPRLTAHLQYDHMRRFVVSQLPIFNEAAQQLALGLRWRYSDRFVYEWRFVEDFSDVSPDFTVAFQLGMRWNRTREAETQ